MIKKFIIEFLRGKIWLSYKVSNTCKIDHYNWVSLEFNTMDEVNNFIKYRKDKA